MGIPMNAFEFWKPLLMITLFFAAPSFAASNIGKGGGSDGGGNTYRGRPLESYARDPMALPSYNTVSELIADLRIKHEPQSRVDIFANILEAPFRSKIWYFVPGPLDQVPADLLNSAVRTDQAALQGMDTVWIDADIWDKMTLEDQARLLKHEAFMSMKILQFGSDFRQCVAAHVSATYCQQGGRGLQDRLVKLTASDYTDVQMLTIKASGSFVAISGAEWIEMIGQAFTFAWSWFEVSVIMTRTELSRELQRATISNYLPTVGYNLRDWKLPTESEPTPEEIFQAFEKKKEACAVQVKVVGDHLNLVLDGKTEKLNFQIPIPEKIDTWQADLFVEGRKLRQIPIGVQTGRPTSSGGYEFWNMFLLMDSYQLRHVYIQEMVCAEPDCQTPYIDAKDGAFYICSDNPALFKPK